MRGTTSSRHVELVAMAPSGETFISRDREGVIRLHEPARAPQIVSEDVIARAIAAGFVPVNGAFASWLELDNERQRRARLVGRSVEPDVSTWDVDRTRRAIDSLGSWIDQGRTSEARIVLNHILRASPVTEDPDLLVRIADLLARCDMRSGPVIPADPIDERHAAARERMHLPLAA